MNTVLSLRLVKAVPVFAVLFFHTPQAGGAPGANIPESAGMKEAADVQKASLMERQACCAKAANQIACLDAQFHGRPELVGPKSSICMQNCMSNPEMYKCPK